MQDCTRCSLKKNLIWSDILLPRILVQFQIFYPYLLIFAANFRAYMGGKTLKSLLVAVFSVFLALISSSLCAQDDSISKGAAITASHEGEKEEFDANEVIFGHVLDAHEFHFLSYKDKQGKEHRAVIHLPVIMYAPDRGKLSIFSSARFYHGQETYDGYKLEGNKIISTRPAENVYDFSLTRNVVQMIIALIALVWIMMSVAKKYRQGEGVTTPPTGFQNALEPVITFVRDEVAKPNLARNYKKYMPYLLTVFFFILINNLFGLLPGSANVSGNIAFTLVLGLVSFIVILLSSNAHFWAHIFNPPVPIGVKPILVLVEFLSIFTKPFALIIRLFANMLAGHIIIICLISLIFIFGGLNKIAGWGFAPFAVRVRGITDHSTAFMRIALCRGATLRTTS